jgi:hypothetical protein
LGVAKIFSHSNLLVSFSSSVASIPIFIFYVCLCHESPSLSVSLYHIFSEILFIWLITSVSYYHLDLVVAFLSTWLFIFYLGHDVDLVVAFFIDFVC